LHPNFRLFKLVILCFMSSTKTKSTPSFYELIKDYPRDGIRLGEAAGIVKKGLLEEIIIYEEFLFLRDSEPQLKKGDIYDRLARRYGFSVSSIRKKIASMANTNIPPEEYNDLKYFFLHLYLKEKHKQSLLQDELEEQDEATEKQN